MSAAADAIRYSPRDVRRMIWRTFSQHLLPLMLVLLLVGLPGILAGAFEGLSDACGLQADAAAAQCRTLLLSPPENMPEEEKLDRFYASWLLEGELSAEESRWTLLSLLCGLVSLLISPALLLGTHCVILAALRGQPVRWRDAAVTWREFRKALGLEMYMLLLIFLWSLPGLALMGLGRALAGFAGIVGSLGLLLTLAGALVYLGLSCGANLRYLLAPRLLADGAFVSAYDLVTISTDIITWRDVPRLLRVLFPGLLMMLAVNGLHRLVLTSVLPLWGAALLREVLLLIPCGWLLVGGAAVYLTFRSR